MSHCLARGVRYELERLRRERHCMPDYKLEALGPRSFEQLVQSLALGALSPGVTPFGDGPDGGREAIFDGPVDYSTDGPVWDGYGVIQAKFLQRPLGTSPDGNWALKQLADELAQFERPGSRRRIPEYYIYATNATLSSVQNGGTKDRVFKELEEFRARHALKGFDVWDYDKLRALLDGNQDVRTAYDAWITPGDVLAAVIARLDGVQPDFHKLMGRLLARELLDDQFARLEQAGHSPQSQVPLASVFVDIPYSGHPDPGEGIADGDREAKLVADLLGVAAGKLDPKSNVADRYTDLPEPGRFVVIGGPGQGKTTVAQFMCQLFRAALLEDQPNHTLPTEVVRALAILERQRSSSGLTLPTRRFPVHIVLNELARYLAEATPDRSSVIGFISSQMSRRLRQPVSESDLRSWLGAYPWFLVFDGLDEVPASTNRVQLMTALSEFLLDARSDNADMLIVATSRPQGYSDDFSPDSYRHLWLTPLPPADALHYASRLVDVRYGLESDRGALLLGKLERATRQEATVRLMQSPLQVTIMAQLVDKLGQPPQERYTLFKEYYEVIYARELEREIPAAEVLKYYRADVDSIHWRVGLALQTRSELAGGTEARLTRAEFAHIVRSRLEEEEHEGKDLEALVFDLTEAAAHRLVFLVGHESDAIGFEVRSLQEFMAAEALHEGVELLVQARLRRIAPAIHWRNVFLFAAGRCFTRNQALRDTVVAVCEELDDADESGPVLAEVRQGSLLALELLDEGSCRNQPKYLRRLWKLAMRVLALPLGEEHSRLARVAQDLKQSEVLIEVLSTPEPPDGLQVASRIRVVLALLARGNARARDLLRGWLESADIDRSVLLQEMLVFVGSVELVRDELVQLLPQVPPRAMAVSSTRFLTAQPAWEDLPEWARSVLAIHAQPGASGRRTQFKLGTGGTRTASRRGPVLELVPLESEANRLIPLRDMPYDHQRWSTYVAAADFALEPTRDSLTSALERGLEEDAPQRLALDAPWPLGALLRRPGGVDAATVAEAQAGAFGDVDDWRAAELRWRRNGVSLDDFAYTVSELADVAVSPEFRTRGFPLGTYAWFVTGVRSVGVEGMVQELLALKEDAVPSPARGGLSRLIVRLLGSNVLENPTWAEKYASCYLDAVLDASVHLGQPQFVNYQTIEVLRGHLSAAERAVLYDFVGDEGLVSPTLEQRPGLAADVARSFVENPTMLGHLKVLLNLYRADPYPLHLVQDLVSSPLPDPTEDHADDRLLIHLMVEGPTDSLLPALGEMVRESPRPAQFVVAMDEVLTARGADPASHERVLLHVKALDVASTRLPVFRALQRLARGRRSGLAELSARDELCICQLPATLFAGV